MKSRCEPDFTFRVELIAPGAFNPDDDAEVWFENGEWRLERGDFRATWNRRAEGARFANRRIPIRSTPFCALRIRCLLARTGGFLLMPRARCETARLSCSPDCLKLEKRRSLAWRLPMWHCSPMKPRTCAAWTIDIWRTALLLPAIWESPGKNVSAPSPRFICSKRRTENRIDPIDPAARFVAFCATFSFSRTMTELVRLVFDSAFAFVASVPVYELSFFPDQRVWDLIG